LTRLSNAFAKGRPALVTFVTGGDPTPDATASILANLCGRSDKDIFSVAEHLGVSL
jgi:tryptophan synthase alpha subunit